MRPPAPMTPRRRVSLAPSTLVEARAVNPLAMIKLRRFKFAVTAIRSDIGNVLVAAWFIYQRGDKSRVAAIHGFMGRR